MINILCKLYSKIQNRSFILEKIKFYSLLRLNVRIFANTALPIYFLVTRLFCNYKLEKSKNEGKRIIVSLTSFPARINRLWIVIECMLRQSKKPDKIILWLSKEQFANFSGIPKSLQVLQSRGLDIELVDGDIRSHKKYYYVFKKFPNDYIITIDDDIIYRTDLIERLWNSYCAHKTIVAAYGYNIQYANEGLLPYKLWPMSCDGVFENLFFGSGGGVLFPPNLLYKDLLNIDLALNLCPTADDIWLNTMARLSKQRIVKILSDNVLMPIINLNNVTLASQNLAMDKNDEQIDSVSAYYFAKMQVNPFFEY